MSCIIKGNDYLSASSVISGFPISMVTNVKFEIRTNLKRLDVSFTIPQHRFVVRDNILSELSEVYICARNDRVPENHNDYQAYMSSKGPYNGDSSNGSAIFYFEDNGWEWVEGSTVYIRFFMINTDGLINSSTSGVYVYKLQIASETLQDNDWSTISLISEAGNASNYWNIGDQITVPITGDYACTLKLQIWDFNHFDKSDGSGKAGICFGCRILPFMEGIHTSNTNTCGWEHCDLRVNILQKVYNGFPQELKDVIKSVKTISYPGNRSINEVHIQEKIFIPSMPEINLSNREPSAKDGYQLPIFTDNASRKKTTDDGALHSWWTRTPEFGNSEYFYYVYYSSGDYGQVVNASTRDIGVAFCFNI